ncbi:hypothetical protein JOC75_000731 [Metabacillus crassostreae]|uniref:hypothetical protein n=1 Tax=Metabacillus crassostreae TaxID=929098 RepID=UPI00195EC649|nr:hypothetical protein [Metabacillus crassostreae]MBM7602761.1 hypothetical protein [Metabacillus crassostreae]
MHYVCPVCGFDKLDEPAYNKYNEASYEICPCCQFQFGVDDDVEISDGVFMLREETHTIYRNKWVEDGAEIFQPECYPQEFQSDDKVKKEYLIQQLKNIIVSP